LADKWAAPKAPSKAALRVPSLAVLKVALREVSRVDPLVGQLVAKRAEKRAN